MSSVRLEPNYPGKLIQQVGYATSSIFDTFFVLSVFATHHHWDHSGGNIELVAKKPGLAVYGADARIPEINYVCKDKEEFKLGSLDITPLHTPCHTKGHVCYYVSDPNTGEKAVFSGE